MISIHSVNIPDLGSILSVNSVCCVGEGRRELNGTGGVGWKKLCCIHTKSF